MGIFTFKWSHLPWSPSQPMDWNNLNKLSSPKPMGPTEICLNLPKGFGEEDGPTVYGQTMYAGDSPSYNLPRAFCLMGDKNI